MQNPIKPQQHHLHEGTNMSRYIYYAGPPGPRGPAGPSGPPGQNVSSLTALWSTYGVQHCQICCSANSSLSFWISFPTQYRGNLEPLERMARWVQRENVEREWVPPQLEDIQEVSLMYSLNNRPLVFQGPLGYQGERGFRGESVSVLHLNRIDDDE